jgi:hypothetical protein
MRNKKVTSGKIVSRHLSLLNLLLLVAALALHAAICEEARAAVNGSPLRRVERHSRLLTALCALHRDLDTLADTGGLGGGNGGETFVLGLLAGLAPLGLVLQAFVMKEDLLPARPDEIISAINTLDRPILELHLRMTPLPIGCACDLSL